MSCFSSYWSLKLGLDYFFLASLQDLPWNAKTIAHDWCHMITTQYIHVYTLYKDMPRIPQFDLSHCNVEHHEALLHFGCRRISLLPYLQRCGIPTQKLWDTDLQHLCNPRQFAQEATNQSNGYTASSYQEASSTNIYPLSHGNCM